MTKEKIIKLAIERGMTYNPETGSIYGIYGKLIKRKKSGYIRVGVRFENKIYQFRGHIFAWYYTYGKMPDNQIDHINGVRDDNRISNLRDVTNQENQWNRTKTKGYYWYNQKWLSKIKVDGKIIYLGLFNTESEARQAYIDAKKIYHIIL